MIVYLGTPIEFPCESCKHNSECKGVDEFRMAYWRYRVECADFEREYDDTGFPFPKPTDTHFFNRK